MERTDAGNPMRGLTFDSGCGSNRDVTLGEVFEG
jgi:hypothetical protein